MRKILFTQWFDSKFDYYMNIAKNRGFNVCEDFPNVLIFDINSPSAKPYLLKRGILDDTMLFKQRHILSSNIDINIIYNTFIKYYNKLVMLYPHTKIIQSHSSARSCVSKKTTSHYVKRFPVSIDNEQISESLKMKTYVRFLNIENGRPFNEPKVKEIQKYSTNLLKKLDKQSAISYINNIFKDEMWNKDYGYDDWRKGLKISEQEKDDSDFRPGGSSGGY